MRIVIANHSSYPRPARGEDGELIAEAVRDQEAAGLDVVTDGQVTWKDPVTSLLGRIDGVRLGKSVPFLDGTTLVPRPIIEARLRARRPLVVAEFQRAARHAQRTLKAVALGPYTLARLSSIATTAYRSIGALAADLATILAAEIRALVAAGARAVQVDEPLILAHPQDIRMARDLLEPLKDAAGDLGELTVATYWGPAQALYAQLNTLPADVIGLDVISDPGLIDAIAETGAGKVLALGLLDGRCARVEAVDDGVALVRRALHRYVHDRLVLQPSCGLGGLSRAQARAKLECLARVRERLG